MEVRQLEIFTVLADELHFGRAAERLFVSQPSLSEQVRKLERELGTPLFLRTSRHVELTAAGRELRARARAILTAVADAEAAVRAVAGGETGRVRVGVTPPAAPLLAPHLVAAFAATAPGVDVQTTQMWLPGLQRALAAGEIDVLITPGMPGPPPGTEHRVLGHEPILAGLRTTHALAGRPHVAFEDLVDDVLGVPSEQLFPAWTTAQRRLLHSAGVAPPTVPLQDADLTAARWSEQQDVDWVLLTPSLTRAHPDTVAVPFSPPASIPFVLQWLADRAAEPALARFVACCLSSPLPPGWTSSAAERRPPAG